jgi:hypothetical protein
MSSEGSLLHPVIPETLPGIIIITEVIIIIILPMNGRPPGTFPIPRQTVILLREVAVAVVAVHPHGLSGDRDYFKRDDFHPF